MCTETLYHQTEKFVRHWAQTGWKVQVSCKDRWPRVLQPTTVASPPLSQSKPAATCGVFTTNLIRNKLEPDLQMGLPDILVLLEYRRLRHCRAIQGDPGGEWWGKIFPVGRIWAVCLIVHYYWSGRWTEALILLVHKPLLMIWFSRNKMRLLVTGKLGEEICGWNFQNGNGVWKYFCHLWALTKEASPGEETLKNQEDKIMPSGGVSQPLSAVIQCLRGYCGHGGAGGGHSWTFPPPRLI